jgi:SAM-dependent methyltransferase
MDAHAWDERYAAVPQVWSRGPNQFVAAGLAGLPPGDALDLACGEGRNALWLAGLGWRVTAIDFSAVAVERGRGLAEAAGVQVDWRADDVLTAELPEADLVVLAYLQLPADERRLAVRRAWGCLRTGGTFFLVAHDTSNLTEGTGGPQDATVLYSAADVLGDLGDLDDLGGTEVVRAERVARVVAGEDDHGGAADRTAWDVLVHLVRR